MMFLGFFSSISNSILTGWQKFKTTSFIGIINTIVKIVVGIGLLKIGFGVSGVMGGFVLSVIVGYIMACNAKKLNSH